MGGNRVRLVALTQSEHHTTHTHAQPPFHLWGLAFVLEVQTKTLTRADTIPRWHSPETLEGWRGGGGGGGSLEPRPTQRSVAAPLLPLGLGSPVQVPAEGPPGRDGRLLSLARALLFHQKLPNFPYIEASGLVRYLVWPQRGTPASTWHTFIPRTSHHQSP